MKTLQVRNRQKTRKLDTRLLRAITLHVLEEALGKESFQIAVHLVDAKEITALNETFLHHEGPTDVITFDYNEGEAAGLNGEIFICVEEAERQARRFRTTWPAELARYVVHGILHLEGYDDATPAQRRKMKKEEDRLVKMLRDCFAFGKLQRNIQ